MDETSLEDCDTEGATLPCKCRGAQKCRKVAPEAPVIPGPPMDAAKRRGLNAKWCGSVDCMVMRATL